MLKIGKEVEIAKSFKINTTVSEKVLTVKEGDKGFFDSKGYLNLITGKGKGKTVKIKDIEIRGYDHENISKMIFTKLNSEFGLKTYLQDKEIDVNEFMEKIEDVLMVIL